MATNDAASRALGDGVVEGGGFATAQVKLPNDFMLGLQSEVDALEGGNDSSRHANFVNIIALTHAVPGIKNLSASRNFQFRQLGPLHADLLHGRLRSGVPRKAVNAIGNRHQHRPEPRRARPSGLRRHLAEVLTGGTCRVVDYGHDLVSSDVSLPAKASID